MIDCRYKKRIQLYLDGFTAGEALKDIEEHLKVCSDCQAEMTELVEVQTAALEIIEQAPDHSYWHSFASRVRNRIIARDVEPEKVIVRKPAFRFPIFRLASVLAIMVIVMGTALLLLRQPGEKGRTITAPTAGVNVAKQVVPSLPVSVPDNPQSNPNISNARASLPQIEPAEQPEAPTYKPLPKQTDYSALEPRDPSNEFRPASLASKAKADLSNDLKLTIPLSLAGNQGSIDPAFHLKNTFVDQRILASIAIIGQNASGGANQGPLYGYNVSSLTGSDEGDASSSWGYLRIASDTSKSSEIKKYFIELELMQAK